jgi:hypothetical protein
MKVFISYSSGSKKWAQKLATALSVHGINPRLDDEEPQAGTEWQSEMEQAVKSADYVVELFDEHDTANTAQRRKWANILDVLWDEPKTPLIPILLRDAELPGFLHGGEATSGTQAIRVKDPGSEWDTAVKSVIEIVKDKKALDEVNLGEVITVSSKAKSEQQRRLDYVGRVAETMKSARKEGAE